MEILHNNCHFYGDISLCGTRGWFYEEDKGGHDWNFWDQYIQHILDWMLHD